MATPDTSIFLSWLMRGVPKVKAVAAMMRSGTSGTWSRPTWWRYPATVSSNGTKALIIRCPLVESSPIRRGESHHSPLLTARDRGQPTDPRETCAAQAEMKGDHARSLPRIRLVSLSRFQSCPTTCWLATTLDNAMDGGNINARLSQRKSPVRASTSDQGAW